MNGWSLFRVQLGQQHARPGKTKHRLVGPAGAVDFPPFVALEIVTFAEDQGFYLMYEPEQGHGTDTYHLSLDDAFHQAEWEFRVKRDEWVETKRNY